MLYARWTVTVCSLRVAGCSAVIVPPPVTPAHVAPPTLDDLGPVADGRGRVLIDVTNSSSRVELVLGHSRATVVGPGYAELHIGDADLRITSASDESAGVQAP